MILFGKRGDHRFLLEVNNSLLVNLFKVSLWSIKANLPFILLALCSTQSIEVQELSIRSFDRNIMIKLTLDIDTLDLVWNYFRSLNDQWLEIRLLTMLVVSVFRADFHLYLDKLTGVYVSPLNHSWLNRHHVEMAERLKMMAIVVWVLRKYGIEWAKKRSNRQIIIAKSKCSWS